MTNKPMLSVEREEIERAIKLASVFDDGSDGADAESSRSVVGILSAFLDKPAPERKPFAWYRVPKDFPLQGAYFPYIEGQSERDIQNSLEAEFGFNVKRLYDEPAAQQQGGRVDYDCCANCLRRLGEHDSRGNCPNPCTSTWHKWDYAFAPHQGEPVGYVSPAGLAGAKSGKTAMFRSCVVGVYTIPLYAEPPAPVAVVMPERMDPRDPYDSEADQWNACLDEVARLNGVKP